MVPEGSHFFKICMLIAIVYDLGGVDGEGIKRVEMLGRWIREVVRPEEPIEGLLVAFELVVDCLDEGQEFVKGV